MNMTYSDPITGDFVCEPLMNDTRIYQVIRMTAHTITVRKTLQGRLVRSDDNGSPYPSCWYAADPDPFGHTMTLRRRKNTGRFEWRKGLPVRHAPRIDGVPVKFVDNRY